MGELGATRLLCKPPCRPALRPRPSADPTSPPCAPRVKPAIFDLLLAVCIGAYLGMAYTAVQVSRQGRGWGARPREQVGLAGASSGLLQGVPLTQASHCPQHFDLLYRTVQRLLLKAKTQ